MVLCCALVYTCKCLLFVIKLYYSKTYDSSTIAIYNMYILSPKTAAKCHFISLRWMARWRLFHCDRYCLACFARFGVFVNKCHPRVLSLDADNGIGQLECWRGFFSFYTGLRICLTFLISTTVRK